MVSTAKNRIRTYLETILVSFRFQRFLMVCKLTQANKGNLHGFWLDLGAAEVAIAMETRETTAWCRARVGGQLTLRYR